MYVKFVKAEFDVWSIIIGPDLSKHNSSVTRLVTKTLSNIIWFSNFPKLYNVPSYFPIWGISKVHKRRINTIYFRFKPICGWCWSQSKEVAEMSVMSEHFIFSKLCLLISCAGPGPVPRGEERGDWAGLIPAVYSLHTTELQTGSYLQIFTRVSPLSLLNWRLEWEG